MSLGFALIVIPIALLLFFNAMKKAPKQSRDHLKDISPQPDTPKLQLGQTDVRSAHHLNPPVSDRSPPIRQEIFTAWIADPETRTITSATWNADINTIWSILKLEKFWITLKVQILDANHAALIPYLERHNKPGYKSFNFVGLREKYSVPVLIIGAEDPIIVTGIQNVSMTKEQIQNKIYWHPTPQEASEHELKSMKAAHEYYAYLERKKRNSYKEWD